MSKYWPADTPEERGKLAEERFFKAWENEKDLPKWIVSIARPTTHEDRTQKTDAVIVRIHGPNLRIQIKSYFLDESDRQALMEYGVIPVSIRPNYNPRRIRQLTYQALKEFSRFNSSTKKEPKKQTEDSYYYYKRGKRHKSNHFKKSR